MATLMTELPMARPTSFRTVEPEDAVVPTDGLSVFRQYICARIDEDSSVGRLRDCWMTSWTPTVVYRTAHPSSQRVPSSD